MKALGLALLAAGLSGCASVPDERVDYVCRGSLSTDVNRAASVRLLDAKGRLRSGSTEWTRHDASDLLDVRGRWRVEDGPPVLARATLHVRFYITAFTQEIGQLSLSTDAANFKAGWSTGHVRHLTLSGGQLRMLLRDGETIWVALFNRKVQLMGATGIEAIAFAQGVDLARQADAMSLAASRDYRRRCQRQTRIVAA